MINMVMYDYVGSGCPEQLAGGLESKQTSIRLHAYEMQGQRDWLAVGTRTPMQEMGPHWRCMATLAEWCRMDM